MKQVKKDIVFWQNEIAFNKTIEEIQILYTME